MDAGIAVKYEGLNKVHNIIALVTSIVVLKIFVSYIETHASDELLKTVLSYFDPVLGSILLVLFMVFMIRRYPL